MNPITKIFAIGAPVLVVDVDGAEQLRGHVTAHFIGSTLNSGPALFYIVELEPDGFWSKDGRTFVAGLSVHADNVRDGVRRCPECSDVLTDRGNDPGVLTYCDTCDREVREC